MFSFAAALAQTDVEPLLSESKVWTMRYHLVVPPAYGDVFSYAEYRVTGEITISGIPFKKVLTRSRQEDEEYPEEWKDAGFTIGQNGDKVYLHYNSYDDDFICTVMDFSLNRGDVFQLSMSSDPNDRSDFTVTEMSDVVLENSADQTPRKCLHLQPEGMLGWDEVWIEGIGSLTGGLMGTAIYRASGTYPNLMRCVDNDKLLFEYGTTTSMAQPPIKHSVASSRIHDLQGRRVNSLSAKGIYIQNGRKVVVK